MTNNIQKTILKGSVACILALMATNAGAVESFIRNDGSVNWSAVDNLQAIDKSIARQYRDTMNDWNLTIQKEAEENKTNAVVQQVAEIADKHMDMLSANQALVAANQHVTDILSDIERLEQEKARLQEEKEQLDSVAGNLYGGTWGLDPTGGMASVKADLKQQEIDAKQQEIDQKMAEAKKAMSDAEAKRDLANAANDALRAMEAQLDPALSQELLGEALQSGIGLDQLDAAMADPGARAVLQKDLDNMYDKYLSDVPKVDLDTPDGQAYAKSFLTALSGQTQAGESNNVPSHMLSGNAAIDGYQNRGMNTLEQQIEQARSGADSESNGGFIGSESQIQPQNQAAQANAAQSATPAGSAGNSTANQSASDVINQRMLEAARNINERELAAAQASAARDLAAAQASQERDQATAQSARAAAAQALEAAQASQERSLQRAQESYDRQVQQLSGGSVGAGSGVQSTH